MSTGTSNGCANKASVLGNSDKPPLVEIDESQVPMGLTMFDRWTAWDWVWNSKRQHWDKPPKDAKTGYTCDGNDPANWYTFTEALAAQQAGRFDGIGFVNGQGEADLHHSGIDLDDCRNPATGELSELAKDIIEAANTYTEISPSGTGVKIFLYGNLPKGHKAKNESETVEIYTRKRYFTVTGRRVEGTPATVEHRQEELEVIWQRYIGSEKPAASRNGKAKGSKAKRRKGTVNEMALCDMLLIPVKPDENDGSERLLICGKVAVEFNLSDADAIATWQAYAKKKPFPKHYTDEQFLKRLDDAEKHLDTERGSRTPGAEQTTDWPEPEPFQSEKLPKCPVEVLPPPLRDWAIATAEATQTPVDMSVMQAITVCSAAIAGRIDCEVRSGYKEPLNLYTATMMAPGNRKSSVHASATAPLHRHEQDLIEKSRFDIAATASERRVQEKRLTKLENQAANGGEKSNDARAELREVAIWLQQFPIAPDAF